MSGVSPTVVCVTPDTQIYFFDHPKRQPQTLRLSFSVSHLQTAKRNVPAHALWQVNCGFRSDSVRYSLPWSLKCDHSCCNALCCQLRASHLQAYAMVAKGLFFRIPFFDLSAIISNATLSSCVRPPCVQNKKWEDFCFLPSSLMRKYKIFFSTI